MATGTASGNPTTAVHAWLTANYQGLKGMFAQWVTGQDENEVKSAYLPKVAVDERENDRQMMLGRLDAINESLQEILVHLRALQ